MLLVGHEFHAMQGLKLIAPASFVCLAAMSAATELPKMIKADASAIVLANWPLFIVAACMGLCVNLISLIVIKASWGLLWV